ncbi:hypothetical protein JCM11491_006741 [Sporobolomyces phaffii]
MDAQTAAQAAYAQMGFLVLTDLPKGSEFGLDGQFWTVNEFSGVKLIPAGLHVFVVAAAPSPASRPSTSEGSPSHDARGAGIGVRHALLKFYKDGALRDGKGEVVIEAWDPSNEALAYEPVESRLRPSSGRATAATTRRNMTKRRRRTVDPAAEPDEPVVSTEYLQTLDRSLAPYPPPESEPATRWKGLSGYITEATIARVVGIDRRGVAVVDALVEGWREEEELVRAKEKQQEETTASTGTDVGEGKTFWGKKRPQEEAEVTQVFDGEEHSEGDEADREGLEFARFDDKRSWPPGAVGPELSRWSKDKSWLLSHVVETRLGGDAKELLAELQLSFALFTLVYNFSALTSYKSLFSLICRASLLAHPSSSRPRDCDSTLPSPLLTSETTLPLFASFLAVIESQMAFLEPTFFSTQLPSLESHLVSSLSHLRAALSDASPHWYALASDSPASPIWTTLVARWNALAATTMERFGWDLGLIEGSKAKYGRLKTRLDSGDGQVPFEELEEGEDAPVIVDLEDGDEDAPIFVGFER